MPLHEGVVYGPLRSRRLGWSLGINVLPPGRKVCSFNCVYCQYGWTESYRRSEAPDPDWPTPDDIAAALTERLQEVAASHGPVDRLTLAGHGEPTLHPRFPEVVERLRDVRDACAPGARLAILSNSTTAHEPGVRQALGRLDERYMKLDGGDADTIRRVNVSAVDFERLASALSELQDINIQTMFVRDARGLVDNTTPAAIEAWLRALARIRPREVQNYSLARNPALARLESVPADELRAIASRVLALGIQAYVF